MGRRKLEMKRIEDKSSRQVTFSKRRAGLIKKARQLSILCDVDIAVVIFSGPGRLYEAASGGSSVAQILSRYHNYSHEAEATAGAHQMARPSPCTKFRTCAELLQAVERLAEEPNAEELTDTVTELEQLEEELNAALMQTRSRKTQLMMEHHSALYEKEKQMVEENQKLQQQIESAKLNGNPDDSGGGLHGLATNRVNLPQPYTLQLFTD